MAGDRQNWFGYVVSGGVAIAAGGFVILHQPEVLLWYLLISLLGLLAMPLAYRLLPGLPGKGYAFTKILGLLITSYVFWLAGVLAILENSRASIIFVLLVFAMISVWLARRIDGEEIRQWLRGNLGYIGSVEILFALGFFGWAFLRGFYPEIVGTEKPMELAFINAILRSPRFPPLDPWLSGYAISYYHFGYIMVAMLAKATGTSGSVAFNIALSMWFGLSAVGAYGVLYNLLAKRQADEKKQAIFQAWLAPFFVLIVSNMEGFLHWLHNKGVFWHQTADGTLVSTFWSWLGIRKLDMPPSLPVEPLQNKFWWWWQASRVIRDFDLQGMDKGDVINEFPMFSYLLGDLHPHVLAMPFAFLVIAIAMNLYFLRNDRTSRILGMRLSISPEYYLLTILGAGALGFLNTWDLPFYVALVAGAYALKRQEGQGFSWKGFGVDFLLSGLLIGLGGGIAYLPFYLSFSSQAGGLLPNLIYITRGSHLWVMFMPLFVPLFAWLGTLLKKETPPLIPGIRAVALLILLLLGMTFAVSGIIYILPLLRALNPQASLAPSAYLASLGASDWSSVIVEGFRRRLVYPGSLLTLFALLSILVALLLPRRSVSDDADIDRSRRFVWLFVSLGVLLILVPEFVFLRDLFGYRINTIFKFYFQAWILLGLGAAYALVEISTWWRSIRGWLGYGLIWFIILLTLLYPIYGLAERTGGFSRASAWTLDGTAYFAEQVPAEAAAAEWLQFAPLGVVAEAVGGSYTGYARMATHSGQPTVLGWEFHEVQWRGGTQPQGSRKVDIERLYCTTSWDEAKNILEQYRIRYVVVGNLEQMTYQRGNANCPTGLQTGKFIQNLSKVFEQDNVVIFRVY